MDFYSDFQAPAVVLRTDPPELLTEEIPRSFRTRNEER